MVRRAVLEALAQAIAAGEGDEGAARRLRIDPVLRPFARRRLRAAVLDAIIEAPASESVVICQRAYLILAGQRAAPDETDAALATRFAALRASAGPPPRRSYLVTIATAVALAALVGFPVWRAFHPGPADAWHRSAHATVAGPAALAPDVASLFQQHLVAFLLQLDRLTAVAASEAPDAAAMNLIGQQVEIAASEVEARCAAALTDALCPRLVAVLASARQVGEHGGDDAEHTFLEAVGRFDDELARAGLAVYLDGDVVTESNGRRHVIVYAYTVDATHRFRAGTHEVRALWLRRLDALNFEQAAAGFVRPSLREALVLLDQTEGELTALLLPALVDGARLGLSGHEDAKYPGREAFEQLAGATVRREWHAALAGDAAGVARVAARLVQREALLDRLDKQLALRGLAMARPTGLRMPDGWLTQLGPEMPHDTRDELADLDEELGSEAAAASFAAARALLAGVIELHEVEHRLDYADSGRRMPAELEAIVGPALFEGREVGGAAAARDEMSAYLSQIARTPGMTGTNLVLIGRFLFDRDLWGSAECDAALVIVAGLARELGLPAEPLVVQHFVDRAAAARLLTLLLARPAADVVAASARLWAHLYGLELAAVERVAAAAPSGH